MSYTRGLWQFFTSFVIIVGILAIIGAWYLLVAIGSVLLIVGVVIYKALRSKEASAAAAPLLGSMLSQKQSEVVSTGGRLQSSENIELRVVNMGLFTQNHSWLAKFLQVDRSDSFEVEGAILASYLPIESPEGSVEKEVIYVVHRDRVLGELAAVDLDHWYDSVLEGGGALKCRLRLTFNDDLGLEQIRVLGQII